MRKKSLHIIYFLLFVGVMLTILKFVFKSSNSELLFIIVFGAFVGIITRFSFSYLNPPDWLYKIHNTAEGAMAGLMIGLFLYGIEYISQG